MTISRQRMKERLRGINIGRLLELINTMRTFLRLSTGLVGIIASASSLLSPQGNNRNDKSKKGIIKKDQGIGGVMISARRGAEILQLALLSVCQLYENIGFLTDQGVLLLPSKSSSSPSSLSGTDANDANDENDKINKTANAVKNHYLTSSRAWMGSVVFSIFSKFLATSVTATTATTKQKQNQQHQGEEYLWWKTLVVPVGISLPLSAHASFEKGLLADEVVALMGLVVAGMGLRKGWVDTEEEEKGRGGRKMKKGRERGRKSESELRRM